MVSSTARPNVPFPQPTRAHLFAAQDCIGGGASGEKEYGRNPLGVLGGDQIPVKSGMGAAARGFAALNFGVILGNMPNEKRIPAAAPKREPLKNFSLSKPLRFRITKSAFLRDPNKF